MSSSSWEGWVLGSPWKQHHSNKREILNRNGTRKKNPTPTKYFFRSIWKKSWKYFFAPWKKKSHQKSTLMKKSKFWFFHQSWFLMRFFFSGCKKIFSTFFSNRPKKIFCWSWIFFSSSISIQNFPLVRMVLFSGRSEHPTLSTGAWHFLSQIFSLFSLG